MTHRAIIWGCSFTFCSSVSIKINCVHVCVRARVLASKREEKKEVCLFVSELYLSLSGRR